MYDQDYRRRVRAATLAARRAAPAPHRPAAPATSAPRAPPPPPVRRPPSAAAVAEDRAGDPLDGLVNLFDLGIVLSVAFLVAALSSVEARRQQDPRQARWARAGSAESAPAGTVTANPGDQVRSVAFCGRASASSATASPSGRSTSLDDGRTIVVERGGARTTP